MNLQQSTNNFLHHSNTNQSGLHQIDRFQVHALLKTVHRLFVVEQRDRCGGRLGLAHVVEPIERLRIVAWRG